MIHPSMSRESPILPPASGQDLPCYSKRNMALKSTISRPKKDIILAGLSGRLVQSDDLQVLKSELAALASEPRVTLILDLSQVEYIDSSGIGTLLYLDGLAQPAGSKLRIAGATRRVVEILTITHTHKVLTLDPDVASSLAQSGS
jgi:anti-sigma B factor antagonist